MRGRHAPTSSSSRSPHSLLFKYQLVHETEGHLGTIYFDLFSRGAKFGGAAHFVIQCGKQRNAFDGRLESALLQNGSSSTRNGSQLGAAASSTDFQLPVVVLVTNFTHSEDVPGGGNSSSEGSGSSASLEHTLRSAHLSLSETETLFHEFGHALHSLLSRTEFQHLHGACMVPPLQECGQCVRMMYC